MLFPLPLFLIDECLAGLDCCVLSQEMRRIGTHWRWVRRGPSRAAGSQKSLTSPRLHPGNETFEIALLFGTEIARHRQASRRLRESERWPEGEDVAPMRHVGAGANEIEVPMAVRRIPKQHDAGQPPAAHNKLFIALRSLILERNNIASWPLDDLARRKDVDSGNPQAGRGHRTKIGHIAV